MPPKHKMSQNQWNQFVKAVRQQSQRAGGSNMPPKGLFAGVGGLVALGLGGLVFASSLYNGMSIALSSPSLLTIE